MSPFDKAQDRPFGGFPARMEFTPVPNIFFSRLLAEIDDIAEVKTLLFVFRLIYGKRGFPRFTTFGELADNPGLMHSLGGGEQSRQALRRALGNGEKRGTILHLHMEQTGAAEDVYFLNTEKDSQTIEKIKNGEMNLPGWNVKKLACPEATPEPPDIFALYEQNIGLLTPMIADELRDAEKTYPETWLRDAIKRAVAENKRKWSYIQGVLERWAREGKNDGTYQRDSKASSTEYRTQKYDHLIQR